MLHCITKLETKPVETNYEIHAIEQILQYTNLRITFYHILKRQHTDFQVTIFSTPFLLILALYNYRYNLM